VFGLAMALDLAGLALTLIFWYQFTISLRGIWVLIERQKELDKELYADLARKREEDRSQLWFHRMIFAIWALTTRFITCCRLRC
jgi:dolichol kinase